MWPIQFAAFVIPTVPRNYWIYLLAAMFGPLQGFLNALVIFCRDKRSISQRATNTIYRFSSNIAINGSSVFKAVSASVKFAVGKEAKKSGEFSVANEEVAQLEIDVGQIERVMEEEQKTPEGNESDESLDEIDERLLQHAMNSDLLNDDDRRHFRGSITIIQRRASIAAS